MKAIVFEVIGKKARVMTEDGAFKTINIKQEDYSCGQEIEIEQMTYLGLSHILEAIKHMFTRGYSPRFRYATITLALLMIIVVGPMFIYTVNASVDGYVNIDINPSIRMAYNRFGVIIDQVPLNEDGVDLLSNIDLTGIKMKDAIDIVIDIAKEKEYIRSKDSSGVMVSITDVKEHYRLDSVTKILKKEYVQNQTFLFQLVLTNKEVFVEASKKSMSPGMYIARQKALANGRITDLDDKISTFELIDNMLNPPDGKESSGINESETKDEPLKIDKVIENANPSQVDENTEGKDQPSPDESKDNKNQPSPDESTDNKDQPSPDESTDKKNQLSPDESKDNKDQPSLDESTDNKDQPSPDESKDNKEQPSLDENTEGKDQSSLDESTDNKNQPSPDESKDNKDQPNLDESTED